MTKQRMIELLEIEHVCMLRKSHDVCDGNCCVCELAQDDYELHEMYINVISTLKAQEPVEPKIVDTSNSKLYHNDMFKNHYCGNCGEFLHTVNRKDLFCSQCGRAVKWK